jgi:hypothetical protein
VNQHTTTDDLIKRSGNSLDNPVWFDEPFQQGYIPMISDHQLENIAFAFNNDMIDENSSDEIKEDSKFFGQLDVESCFDPTNSFKIVRPFATRLQCQQN